jgi:hypothetical protein
MKHSRTLTQSARSNTLRRADQVIEDLRVYLRNGGIKAFLDGTDTRIADAQREIIDLRYSPKHYGSGLTDREREKYSTTILNEIDLAFAQFRRLTFRPAATLATSVEAADRKARLRL